MKIIKKLKLTWKKLLNNILLVIKDEGPGFSETFLKKYLNVFIVIDLKAHLESIQA